MVGQSREDAEAAEVLPKLPERHEGGRVMDRLKQCPFCGTDNFYITTFKWHGFDTVGIFCDVCKLKIILEENEGEGDSEQSRKKAIEAWNRRASDECTD